MCGAIAASSRNLPVSSMDQMVLSATSLNKTKSVTTKLVRESARRKKIAPFTRQCSPLSIAESLPTHRPFSNIAHTPARHSRVSAVRAGVPGHDLVAPALHVPRHLHSGSTSAPRRSVRLEHHLWASSARKWDSTCTAQSPSRPTCNLLRPPPAPRPRCRRRSFRRSPPRSAPCPCRTSPSRSPASAAAFPPLARLSPPHHRAHPPRALLAPGPPSWRR
eukprot:2336458-Rhodomonas_salina.3